MNTNVLIAHPMEPDTLERLRSTFPTCRFEVIPPIRKGDSITCDSPGECSVFVTDLPPANFAEMTQLRWIQLGSAGYQQLQGLPLEERGIAVSNASGVNDGPIAEWCLLMIYALERNLPAMFGLQQECAWQRPVRFQAEVRGKRVGIIGYGNIGREVARLTSAAGLEVWALNRSPIGPSGLRFQPAGGGDPEGTIPARAFTFAEIDTFLAGIDIVIMTAALNERTRGLIGERELRQLPPHTFVLNPARAGLIDESALERALGEGWIAGAAIDSHYREPLQPDDPVWRWPNTILTPHISGSSHSTHYHARLWELFALNLERHLAGKPLLNQVALADLTSA